MSTLNNWTGSGYITPELPAGYMVAINDPQATLTEMRNGGIYFRELGGESDVLLIQCENFLISMYKSLSNQRLLQSFVCRSTSINGSTVIRWVHRQLALSMSFQQAMRSVGENIIVNDSYGTAAEIQQVNQQLASRFCQVFSGT